MLFRSTREGVSDGASVVPPGGGAAQPPDQKDTTEDDERLQHCATDYPAESTTGSAGVVLAGTHGVFHGEHATATAEARYGDGRGARERNDMYFGVSWETISVDRNSVFIQSTYTFFFFETTP